MMNYTGLYRDYKLNRPLTDQEKNGRFYQGKRRRVNTFNDEASVIRMNSNCLETVCKYYSGTGVGSSFIAILTVFVFLIVTFSVIQFFSDLYRGERSGLRGIFF